MNPWIYKGEVFDESLIGDNVGFVYRITCKKNGMRYIGKKQFFSTRTKKVVKKSAKLKKGETTKSLSDEEKEKRLKKVKTTGDSDWRTYHGSSEELKAAIAEWGYGEFEREILQIVERKGLLAYYELKQQLLEDACLRPDYWNGILNVRLNRNIFPKDAREAAYQMAIADNPLYARTQRSYDPDKLAAETTDEEYYPDESDYI